MSDALKSALSGTQPKIFYPQFSHDPVKQPKKYKVSKAKTANTKVEPINTKVETAPNLITTPEKVNLTSMASKPNVTQDLNVKPISNLFPSSYNYNNNHNNDEESDASFLRYAPVLGSMVGLGQSLMSKPDYSNADKIETAA